MDTGFGTLPAESSYRAGSMKTVARELTKYNLYLLAMQEVRGV
jgi:hypothetical protein